MIIDIEEIGPCTKQLKIEVPQEVYTREEDKAYRELSKKAKIPGFRKGKVPRKYLQKMHYDLIKKDVLNKIIPESYYKAVEEKGLIPIGNPRLENIHHEKDSPLTFTATIDILPPLEVKNYEGLEFTKNIARITDEDVEKELNYYKESFATYEAISDRAVKEGDLVIIDYDGIMNDKPMPGVEFKSFPLVIGSNSLIEGLEKGIIGMNKNEEKDISLVYPSDFANKEFAGKEAIFRVKVNEIKLKKTSEINDKFIKDEMGKNMTLKELKEEIRQNQGKREKLTADSKLSRDIVDKLIELNPLEIPQTLVEDQINYMVDDFKQKMRLRGIKDEELQSDRGKFRKDAIRIIKGTLIQQKISEMEKIELDDKEIEEALTEISGERKIAKEKLKISMQKDDSYKNFLDELKRRKVMNVIQSKLKIKETFVARKELEKKPN